MLELYGEGEIVEEYDQQHLDRKLSFIRHPVLESDANHVFMRIKCSKCGSEEYVGTQDEPLHVIIKTLNIIKHYCSITEEC